MALRVSAPRLPLTVSLPLWLVRLSANSLPMMRSSPAPPSTLTWVSDVNAAKVTPLRSMTSFNGPPMTFRDLSELAASGEPTFADNGVPFNVVSPDLSVPKMMGSAPLLTTLNAPARNIDVMLGKQRRSSNSTCTGFTGHAEVRTRRRVRTSACPVKPVQVELLERRCLPSITSMFRAGAVSVVSNGADPIILGIDKSGDTTLNGTPLSAKDGSPLAASSLKSLNVMGGPLNDVIDLSGVTLAAFTSLTQVNVDGGAGDDLIIGSEFADNLTSQSGNDTVSGSLGADTLNAIVVTYTAAELPTT